MSRKSPGNSFGTILHLIPRSNYAMELEEVVKIEWEQLPQRDVYAKMGVANRDSTFADEADSAVSKSTPYLAPVAAGKQRGGWEYLDHTADVQIHSWGTTLGDAFGAAVVGMSAYMVEIDQIADNLEMRVAVSGHDLQSLLYNFMDECLYVFHTESFVVKEVLIRDLDQKNYSISAVTRGGLFDVSQHTQGTEVKAITYSNLQIVTDLPEKAETYVIVDI